MRMVRSHIGSAPAGGTVGRVKDWDFAAERKLLQVDTEMRILGPVPVGSHHFGLAVQDGSS